MLFDAQPKLSHPPLHSLFVFHIFSKNLELFSVSNGLDDISSWIVKKFIVSYRILLARFQVRLIAAVSRSEY